MKALYIMTNDLRLYDNPIFEQVQRVESLDIIYYIHQELGVFAQGLIRQAIEELNIKLKSLGQKVIPVKDLDWVSSKSYDLIYSSYFSKLPIETIKVDTQLFYSFEQMPCSLESLPMQFSPYRRMLNQCGFTDYKYSPTTLPPPKSHLKAAPLPEGKVSSNFRGGELSALERTKYYISSKHIRSYKETRDGLIDFDDSTKLSPYLAFGQISPKTIVRLINVHEAKYGENESTYWVKFELYWRDYFKLLSIKLADKFLDINGISKSAFQVDKNQAKLFESWREASTKCLFVNACMNELNQTGWMSNRGRQNVASYLAKELKVDWRWGAQYFKEKLIDYDHESNWGNWQYLAGVGVDPRNRKFNTERQASIYDPNNEYQKFWNRT